MLAPPPEPPEDGGYSLTLTVDPEGKGSAGASPDKDAYDPGDTVNLSATPADGWFFVKWVVDGVEYASQDITVTMNYNRLATAYFEEEEVVEVPPVEPEVDEDDDADEPAVSPPADDEEVVDVTPELPATGAVVWPTIALGLGLVGLGFAIRRRSK